MTRPLLLRGIRPYGEGDLVDMLVRDGVIAELGASLDDTGAEVRDGGGLIVLPGLVDLHTHLREPGREDAETVETGSRAAAEWAIPPSSANRSPRSPTVTAPTGWTSTSPTSRPRRCTCSTTPAVSATGSVFAMANTAV